MSLFSTAVAGTAATDNADNAKTSGQQIRDA